MNLSISPLTRDEFDTAIEWAAVEGWNPGLHDADVFWQTDPEGYLGTHLNGELVATGSIVSYAGNFGFMGFFIVRPDLRGQQIGTQLWFHRRDTLLARLKPGAAIGMDGVFDMQDWYAKGGFQFSHRNLRMQGVGKAANSIASEIVPLSEVPFDSIQTYDQICFGFDRATFLKSWVNLPDSTALGLVCDEELSGFGVIRRCREGYKIGPLFADDAEVAEALFRALSHHADGEPIWLDIPECNPDAVALAARHHMQEVFGCARMVYGDAPALPWDRIYGVTTFELG